MAIHRLDVPKAVKILKKVSPSAATKTLKNSDDEFVNTIHKVGKKADGGFENIYLMIQDITPEQQALFDELKEQISNTSFQDAKPLPWGELVTIGWY